MDGLNGDNHESASVVPVGPFKREFKKWFRYILFLRQYYCFPSDFSFSCLVDYLYVLAYVLLSINFTLCGLMLVRLNSWKLFIAALKECYGLFLFWFLATCQAVYLHRNRKGKVENAWDVVLRLYLRCKRIDMFQCQEAS